MTPDRWPDIERVFLRALATPPDSREARLREDCAGDEDLLREARALLDAADEAEAFFEEPSGLRTVLAEAVADARSDGDDLPAGLRLGPWQIAEEVGRGGMGTVYRAERADDMFAQTVALKVVKRGMDTDAVLRRFRRERAVLAGLRHPLVAQLLDGGTTPDGRPYLAMEYVEGEPITAYCDHHRLSVSARIDLALQVCDAVAYAHRNLVVHRDLKPSNVLVTAEGAVKLLDFGLAKLLGEDAADTLETRDGPRLLTPEYAAPEQIAGGPITTATDVYALGVVLYKLLSGHRPYRFEGWTAAAIERAVRREEPPRPSEAAGQTRWHHPTAETQEAAAAEIAAARSTTSEHLRRRLRGDLDAILLKALRKEPEARYASVEALAEDLRRHRAGWPVQARRGTTRYRVAKFVRRHRQGVAVAAVLATLIAGFGVQIVRQERTTAVERDKARLVAAFLEDLFLEVDVGDGHGGDYTVRQALEEGERRVEGLDGAPDVKAHMLDVIARVYRALALYDRAEPMQREAASLAAETHGPAHPEALATRHHLAYLLDAMGQDEEADLHYAAVLRARRRSGDPDGLVESTSDYAAFLLEQGRAHAAERLIEEGLAVLGRHPEAGPPDQQGEVSRASFELQLGHLAADRGQAAEAERYYRAAAARYHARYGPDHLYPALADLSLAQHLVRNGDGDEAERLARHAVAVIRRLMGDHHPWTARALTEHGAALGALGATDEARRALEEALRIYSASEGPDGQSAQRVRTLLADLDGR